MGILVPNWSPAIQIGSQYTVNWNHPLAFGLSYANVFNNPINIGVGTPTYSRFPMGTFSNVASVFPQVGVGGVGISGGVGKTSELRWDGGAPTLNQSAGSIFCYTTKSWDDAVGSSRILFMFESGANSFYILKYSDTSWYCGWYPGSDSRVSGQLSLEGNLTGVIGLTWSTGASGNEVFYFDGVPKLSRGSAPTPWDTTGANFAIGGHTSDSGQWSWFEDSLGIIYWTAVWDRVLNDSEIAYLNTNPMCFLVPSEDEIAMATIAIASGLKQSHFRFRTDTGAVDATPTWGANEDAA